MWTCSFTIALRTSELCQSSVKTRCLRSYDPPAYIPTFYYDAKVLPVTRVKCMPLASLVIASLQAHENNYEMWPTVRNLLATNFITIFHVLANRTYHGLSCKSSLELVPGFSQHEHSRYLYTFNAKDMPTLVLWRQADGKASGMLTRAPRWEKRWAWVGMPVFRIGKRSTNGPPLQDCLRRPQ